VIVVVERISATVENDLGRILFSMKLGVNQRVGCTLPQEFRFLTRRGLLAGEKTAYNDLKEITHPSLGRLLILEYVEDASLAAVPSPTMKGGNHVHPAETTQLSPAQPFQRLR
jgi:hypothetical protein